MKLLSFAHLMCMLLSAYFPVHCFAAQNAAVISGDITLKKDANLANSGIHFSDSTYQNSAVPWSNSAQDIYFNAVGARVGIGVQPVSTSTVQVINSTGYGYAAQFQLNNNANIFPALSGSTTGAGAAIHGLNTGAGNGGHFQVFNSSNSSSVLVAETNGSGFAGEFLGNVKVTKAVTFSDSSSQTTAKTDCMGRFEDNGNGTVTDCRSGLIWLKNANCADTSGGIVKNKNNGGILTWADAQTWSAGLADTICGLTDGSYAGDWRLPTKSEWMAMVVSARKQGFKAPVVTNGAGNGPWSSGNLFDAIQSSGSYWSNTSASGSAINGWMMNLNDGSLTGNIRGLGTGYVWPVRSGQ